MDKRLYYEAYETDMGWMWKVYHYDQSGNKEVRVAQGGSFDSPEDAMDACSVWQEENNVDAELS